MTTPKHSSESTPGGRDGAPAAGSIPMSPESSGAHADGQSIGSLVHDATTHLSTLVRAEVELAKSEVAAEVRKGLKGSIYFILALTVLLFSTFFFFFAAAEAITWAGLPRPAGFGIVFGFMLLVAGLCGFLGYRKVRKLRAPARTISTMKEFPSALRGRGDHREELAEGAHAQRLTAVTTGGETASGGRSAT